MSVEQFLSDSRAQRYYRGATGMVISGNGSNIASIIASFVDFLLNLVPVIAVLTVVNNGHVAALDVVQAV